MNSVTGAHLNFVHLAGDGEMAKRMREFDWAATPLGSADTWPQSLRSAVSIMLGSSFPTAIYWGSELRLLYNDAWSHIPGERHPAALGRRGVDVWPDIWDVVGPQFARVLETGEGYSTFDQMLRMVRGGSPARTYWNYSITAIRGEDGEVAGIFNQGNETTDRVLNEQRQAVRLALDERAQLATGPVEVMQAASELLGEQLCATRVGYAEIADSGFAHVARDWTAPGVVSVAGLHRLEDFGSELTGDLRSGRTVRIDDASKDPRTISRETAGAFEALAVMSTINVPLIRNGRLLALLFVHDAAVRQWAVEEVGLIEEVAGRTWAAVERAKAEAQVRESESRLRALVAAGSHSVYRMSPDWQEMRAYGERGFLADLSAPNVRWIDHMDPADRPQIMGAIEDAIRRKEPVELEHRVLRADGSFGWMFSRVVPIFDAGGNIVEWFGASSDVTDLQRTVASLRQSEEQLRLATEAAEVGFWDVDEVNKTLTWPPRVKAMFGISPNVPVSMSDFYSGLHSEDRERVGAAYAAAANSDIRALYDVEYRTVGKEDGIIRWVAAKGRGVFNDSGKCLRVIGTAIDITNRKAEAERLRASEAALRKLAATLDASMDHAPLGFAFFDRGRRYLRVNETLALINGVASEDHVGRTLAEIVPKNAAVVQPILDQVFETGQPLGALEVDGETAAAPGEQRSWLTSFFPVFGEKNEVDFVGTTVIDITDRKQAEAKVRDLNDTLEQRISEALAEKRVLTEVIEGADIFVQVADPQFNWLAINEAATVEFARIFGVVRPKAGDNMLHALRDMPDALATVREVWDRALAGEEFVEVVEFGDARYDSRCYEMRFRTLRGDDGAVIGAYQFGSDVTNRLREQARLALAEAALQQAQKMDAVGRLTGGIAHDFNNLLQGVAGSLELIRRKPEDPIKVRRWATSGLEAAQRGTKLTGQLLAFSRAQKIETKPLLVQTLINGMREMLFRTLGSEINLSFDLDDRCPAVLADPTQLEMAVLNLAINARDAMPRGGKLRFAAVKTIVQEDSELAPGEYVELSVADTGNGMTPDVVAKAFEPFFTTKGVGKGTGLGLSQVYGIARQAGGTAKIDSKPGQGTTVTLVLRSTELPIEESDDEREQLQEGVHAATVLVVDDDRDVRQFLVESLDMLGFGVEVAEDGRQGLAALNRKRPDVLMLDYAMPGMSGAELFSIARARWPDLPIILASGYSDTTAIEAAGANEALILRKPFRVDQLQSAITDALKGYPSTSEQPLAIDRS